MKSKISLLILTSILDTSLLAQENFNHRFTNLEIDFLNSPNVNITSQTANSYPNHYSIYDIYFSNINDIKDDVAKCFGKKFYPHQIILFNYYSKQEQNILFGKDYFQICDYVKTYPSFLNGDTITELVASNLTPSLLEKKCSSEIKSIENSTAPKTRTRLYKRLVNCIRIR